ncbi:hypothetical protein D6779_11575, partial [Candidatus Parcubacteria bacterium]
VGERYGWRPIPRKLNAEEWHKLWELADKDLQGLLKGLYVRDENALKEEWVRPVEKAPKLEERTREKIDALFAEEPSAWLDVFVKKANGKPDDPRSLVKLLGSVTHQELMEALAPIWDRNEQVHIHAILREYPVESAPERSMTAKDMLGRLKETLKSLAKDGYVHLQTASSPEDIEEKARTMLVEDVEEQIRRSESPTDRAPECPLIPSFGYENCLKQLAGAASHHRLVFGPAGAGKSTLLANLAERWRQKNKDVVEIRVGNDPEVATGEGVLRRLIGKIHDICEKSGLVVNEIECDKIASFHDLKAELHQLIQHVIRNKKLANRIRVLVDALDQLPSGDPARNPEWLPMGIGTCVSTLDPDILERFKSVFPEAHIVELSGLDRKNARKALSARMEFLGRKLTEEQESAVLEAAFQGEASCNPLHLSLLGEQAREWYSFTSIQAPSLPATLDSAIENLFNSWRERYGRELTERICALLIATRFGISETELLNLIIHEPGILKEYRKRHPKSPKTGELPDILWSRLHRSMAPYLTERMMQGEVLTDFNHSYFRKVLEERISGQRLSRVKRDFSALLFDEWRAHAESRRVRRRVVLEAAIAADSANDARSLFCLCRDEGFLREQSREQYTLPLESLSLAIRQAARMHDVLAAAEFACHRSIRADFLRSQSPLGDVRGGRVDRALEIIRVCDDESRMSWLLLCAWDMARRGDSMAGEFLRELRKELERDSKSKAGSGVRNLVACFAPQMALVFLAHDDLEFIVKEFPGRWPESTIA